MTKTALVEAIATSAGITKAAAKALAGAVAAMEAALKQGEKVSLVGFGTFRTVQRKAREGRNPQTGKTIKIKARKAVTFRPGAKLAKAVK